MCVHQHACQCVEKQTVGVATLHHILSCQCRQLDTNDGQVLQSLVGKRFAVDGGERERVLCAARVAARVSDISRIVDARGEQVGHVVARQQHVFEARDQLSVGVVRQLESVDMSGEVGQRACVVFLCRQG